MKLQSCLRSFGTKDFSNELQSELNSWIQKAPEKFPLSQLSSSGWAPKNDAGATISDVEVASVSANSLTGTFGVTFREFLQKDCQDLLMEDRHSGKIQFELNPVTGEISFSAFQYPVREYDPDEF